MRQPHDRRVVRPVLGAVVAVAVFGLTGCASPLWVALGAAGSAAAVVEAQQGAKNLDDTLHDTAILASVNHYLFQGDHVLFGNVSVTVEKGRVFLTGSVELPSDRIEATRLAWQAEHVREVVNEVQVRDTSAFVDTMRDSLINTRLRSRILVDSGINWMNVSADTVNGVVYLFGIVRSEEERERVVNHAREIEYVVDVVDHISLASDQ